MINTPGYKLTDSAEESVKVEESGLVGAAFSFVDFHKTRRILGNFCNAKKTNSYELQTS